MRGSAVGGGCLSMIALLGMVFPAAACASEPVGVHWPSFRGPQARGIAEGHSLPARWNVETGENIKWKTPIPGLAHSSPIVWGDRVFVTSAVSSDPDPYLRVGLYGESPKHEENVEHNFRVFCLDKRSGRILWEQSAHRGVPKALRHIKATQANCTPATDGKHVVAFFGSEGLYCFDTDGRLLWKKDLGFLDSGPPNAGDLQWGFASSPVIHDGKVIVLCAVRGDSFIAAYDVSDGREIWRTSREPYPGWCTPTVTTSGGRQQVITNGYKHIGGYDLETGGELWKLHGGGDIPVPTPIVAHDLIFITNAHGGQAPVYAIRTSATGDITLKEGTSSEEAGRTATDGEVEQPKDKTGNEHVAWARMRIGNYMQTPLVYGDLLYCCRDSGILACYEARTGDKQYRQRLASGVGFSASPVAGDGKIYFSSEEGDVFVIETGRAYKLLARNEMGEICMATPAISEGTLIFRTKGHVIAVGG